MTKGVVAVLFVFILCSLYNDSLAQIYRANRLHIVKADLLGAVASHRYSMAYERFINRDMSAQLGFQVHDDGYTVSPEFRFYPINHSCPEGLFLSPFGRILSSNIGGGLGIGCGGLIGYQSLFATRMSTDLFIGPGFSYVAKESKWDIWAGITIGLTF